MIISRPSDINHDVWLTHTWVNRYQINHVKNNPDFVKNNPDFQPFRNPETEIPSPWESDHKDIIAECLWGM